QDIEFLHTMSPAATPADRLPTLAEAERAHIQRVLESVQWNKKEAARILDVSRGTLYRKIAQYQLTPPTAPRSASQSLPPR
ncbi:MAG TPA: helix-turn-helix domain-containing protein, partial [Vicinamibacterales bacterium]